MSTCGCTGPGRRGTRCTCAGGCIPAGSMLGRLWRSEPQGRCWASRLSAHSSRVDVDGADLGERDGTALVTGALVEVLAAGVDRGDQAGADGGEVGDALVDLGELLPGPDLEVGGWAAATADLDQLRHLLEGEPQALGRLDHSQRADRLLVVETVPTRGPVGLLDEAPA